MKSCYESMANVVEVDGPWNAVWYKSTPLKVQFFYWMTALDKISTMDMLWRKGFYPPSICLLCYQHSETCFHLLLHCPFTWKIWCDLMKDFGLTFIALGNLMSLLNGWKTGALNSFGHRVWKLVPTAISWAVWRERNSRIF